MNNGAFKYNPFSLYTYDNSSYRHHIQVRLFSLSTILSQNSNSNLVKVLIYIPALATAFTRMYQDQHWLSDIFLGATIGYFVGVWVHKIHDTKDQSEPVQTNQLISVSYHIKKVNRLPICF
jgi:membrane-associated phospholipid phosphatase